MKNEEMIKEAFLSRVNPEEVADQEIVDQVCAEVREQATEYFGPGVYVKGRLNADMQGISFTFKRPSIAYRLEVFTPAKVDRPQESQEETPNSDDDDDTSNDDDDDSGFAEDTRLTLFSSLNNQIGADDRTAEGSPIVAALNGLIDEGVEPFNAQERDELWELVKPK